MPDARGWPDPANPGFPENPKRNRPHLLQDPGDKRCWGWWTFVGGRVWSHLHDRSNAARQSACRDP